MFEVKTVNDAFLLAAGRGEKAAWLWLDDSGAWQPISSSQVYGRVRAAAGALAAWGIGKGDRVAILSENRWEWAVTDFAVLALGAVNVPLYSTLTAEQVGYMLRDSGAKVVVVSTPEMVEKVWAAGNLPELQRLVVMDKPTAQQPQAGQHVPAWFGEWMAGAEAMQQRDAAFDTQVGSLVEADLATIIYTSGTTGEPKGVALTHGNLASNFNLSTRPFGFDDRDSYISFLPLSHIFERHVDYALMCDGATIAYCTKFDLLPAAMKAVRPTVFVAVPRVYEKVKQGVEARSVGVKRRILAWALRVGKGQRERTLAGTMPRSLRWKLADRLVLSKIREAFGGRVKMFISGGAPLGLDTGGWFTDAGILIFEGYGLTETSPVVSFNYPGSVRMGTIGRPLGNLQLRLAADGELELRGPSILRSYWRKERETAEAFTPDGWFCTGDIVTIDGDGFLSITDRKKELMKTSGGKLIAPQPIENKLKANSLVGAAALVGDTHKFACVLISPNYAALDRWAAERGIATEDHAALVKDATVVAEYRKIVDGVNFSLAPFENIKRTTVVADEWTVEGGELTPSMKLKRRVVERKYAAEIAEFYKDEATASR